MASLTIQECRTIYLSDSKNHDKWENMKEMAKDKIVLFPFGRQEVGRQINMFIIYS